MAVVIDENYCFACGPENPIGLRMTFSHADGVTTSHFTPSREHEGWKDVIHGGILATLMDETMARNIMELGFMILTLKMETQFKRPARPGKELMITASLPESKGKYFFPKSRIIERETGELIAESSAVFVRVEQ